MRRDEAFVLGALAGVLAVWLWRPKQVEDRIRTPVAGELQAIEASTR